MRISLTAVLGAILLLGFGSAAEKLEVTDPSDRASYSLGHQIGQDLKRQGSQIDPEAMRQGLLDGFSGAEPALDPQEMEQVLAALKRKVVAAGREQKRQAAERHREEGAQFLAENEEKEGVITLPSGLQYEVLREGAGKMPVASDRVVVHYQSTLVDGTVFHDSHQGEGEPETLHVSGVIRGLTEALQLMREGARWRLFMPADLAYGRRGPAADRTVIFEVELISVEAAE